MATPTSSSGRAQLEAATFQPPENEPLAAAVDVQCFCCQQLNPSERKFCAGCGAALWEACPSCQSLHRVSEAFCGHCGADLEKTFRQRDKQLQTDIARATELAELHQYDEAVALLDIATRKEKGLRLQSRIEAAQELRAAIAERGKMQRQQGEAAMRQAQECLAVRDYEGAVRMLESAVVRSKEHQKLLEESKGIWREVLALDQQVQKGYRAGQRLELLPHLERLLALQPNHEFACRLADRIRDKAAAAARKGIAEHKHSAVIKMLAQVRRIAASDEVDALLEQVREAQWLLDDLRESPVVDEPLLGMAERALKAAPGHPSLSGIREKLAQRIKAPLSHPRSAAPVWANSPETSVLGLPVDWLGGFSLAPARPDVDRSLLRRHPGRFFVAYGLALQGIDSAALGVNLLPREQKSLRDRLSMLPALGRRSPRRAAWGIDLGVSGLKAVRLSCESSGADVRLEEIEFLAHAKPIHPSQGAETRLAIQRATLEAFLAKRQPQQDRIAFGLPGGSLLERVMQLPMAKGKKLAQLVQFEASQQIPVPLDELYWDYQSLLREDAEQPADELPREIVLAAAVRRGSVAPLLAMFEDLKLPVQVLQSDAIAIYNAAWREFFSENQPAADPRRAVALLDMGSDGANLVVCGRGAFWSRRLRVGGADFTNRLVQEFQLTFAQAEQIKHDPSKAPSVCRAYDALGGPLGELIRELDRSLAAFRNEHPQVSVERLWGLGGGFELHGMLRLLRQGLPQPTDLRRSAAERIASIHGT